MYSGEHLLHPVNIAAPTKSGKDFRRASIDRSSPLEIMRISLKKELRIPMKLT